MGLTTKKLAKKIIKSYNKTQWTSKPTSRSLMDWHQKVEGDEFWGNNIISK